MGKKRKMGSMAAVRLETVCACTEVAVNRIMDNMGTIRFNETNLVLLWANYEHFKEKCKVFAGKRE